jgi:LacI family transcriptional regulator
LAAYLIGRFLPREPREIALFTGSLSYRGHEEREMGFRHLIAEEFSHLEIVEYREVREDSVRAHEETRQLLKTRPAIAGIYNIGGGLRGIAEAISESGMSGKVILLGHELTNRVRRYLVDGTVFAVIDQNPRVEAREAIDRLRRVAVGQVICDAVSLRTQVIFRENIPDV